jgi:chromosome segregation protein
VEQDRVSRIIHAKPEERRVVIEEVAGISKYRSRRDAAQRKMDATRQNLLRIQDVRREIDHQMRSLERQAKKAERFRKIRQSILDLERRSFLRNWNGLRQKRDDLGQQRQEVETKRDELLTRLQVREAALEKERLEIVQKERESADAQEKLFKKESEVQGLEGRIQGILQEIQGLETMDSILDNESSELRKRIETALIEYERFGGEREVLEREREIAERRVQEIQISVEGLVQDRERLLEDLEIAKVQLVEMLSERARLRNSLNHYQRQALELERFLQRHQEERGTLQERIQEFEQSQRSIESRIKETEAQLEAFERERSLLSEQGEDLDREKDQLVFKLEKTRDSLHEMSSRLRSLEDLQDSLEGFGEGTKALRAHNQRGEVFGGRPLKVVAEVMEVPETTEAAVAGLLGEQLQYLVVEEIEDALEAMNYIGEQGLGRVGFVTLKPGDRSGGEQTDKRMAGTMGASLLDGIKWEPGYEVLGDILLNGVQVVENASKAVELWRSNGNQAFVTHDGEVLRPPGIMEVGERKGASRGYLSRKREIKRLEEKIAILAEEEHDLTLKRQTFERDKSAIVERIDEQQRKIHHTEIVLTESRKDLDQTKESLRGATQRIEALQWELEETSEELAGIRETRKQESDHLVSVEASIAGAEQQVQSMEGKSQKQQQALDKCHGDLTQARVTLAAICERLESHQRELQRLEVRIRELKEERSRKHRQREEGADKSRVLNEDVQRLRETLQSLLLEHERAQEGLKHLRRELDDRRTRLKQDETVWQEERREQRDLEQMHQGLQLQHQELILRMEHLEGELTGRLQMDAQDIPEAALIIPEEDHEEERERLVALKTSLQRLGDVNLTAVEQYEELKERFDFLTSQQEDLEESIRSLDKAIQKINRTSRKRFKEAFSALDEQFSKVFPILFEGGEAHLVLTEAADVLEAGVEIIVRPPGKRLQSISLLSGGEKALSAVALIFAMLIIKPAPFCLLDEVDAPLDDANIDRFHEVLRELAKESQFILVTHNKRTMEMAEVLYGVTMETPGISTLMSVRLQ